MDDARLDSLRALGPEVAAEVEAVRACRAPLTRAQALGNLARELLAAGAAQEALECARASHELATRPLTSSLKDRVIGAFTDPGTSSRGRDGLAATALRLEGAALLDLGRADEAVEPLRFSYRWFASRGEHDRERDAASALCSALDTAGRDDEAAELLTSAIARAEARGDVAESERWRAMRARRDGWLDDDPAVVEADVVAARQDGSWPDVGLLALMLARILEQRGDRSGARAYADVATRAYSRLSAPAMRPNEARARWMAAWLTDDDDPARLPALVDAEASLRSLGDHEGADACRSDVLATLVRVDGWGAASEWAASHPDHEGACPPPDTALLADLWTASTTAERGRQLLRGASDDGAPAGLLQALAVSELRWGDLDTGLALLDRAVGAADAELRPAMQHDRALALLTRGRADEGVALLEQLLLDAEQADRPGEAAGLAHELAAWRGRDGDVAESRRRYEQALAAHRAAGAGPGAPTGCASRDAEHNLLALDGAEVPDGFSPFRSGGFAMSWCDGEPVS